MPENTESQFHTKTQQQRWIKYGANVGLTVVLVIIVAALVIYMAQLRTVRADTTAGNVYSLKPQTINIIKDLKKPIRLVALYSEKDSHGKTNVYRQPVVDLLEEYQRKGKNIQVEAIDPAQNESKVDDLVTKVISTYGGEVKKYKDVIDTVPAAYDQIKKIAAVELERMQKTGLIDEKNAAEDANRPDVITLAVATVRNVLPELLSKSQKGLDKYLAQKIPDYKGASSSAEQSLGIFSALAGQVLEDFNKSKDDKQLTEPMRRYMLESRKSFEEIKKIADNTLKGLKNLGDLKLDDLRQSLRVKDAILVMSGSDMRVIPFEQVWKIDQREVRQLPPGAEMKPKFAGEQAVSTAILALNQDKKAKVAFIRPGGGPLTTAGFPGVQRGGPLSEVASRLRDYNFEVLEKDLSGMYAMQAQMSGQPAPPEPTDEQIKDAIWVVIVAPTGQNQMAPPPNYKKVGEHLKAGGSALLIFFPQGDNMDDVLKDWGIQVRTDLIAAHEPIKAAEGRQGDMLEEAPRYPYVFDLQDYGDHLITRPLRSLKGLFAPFEVVKTIDVKDVKVTPILAIPQGIRSWGESNLADLENDKAEFEPDKGDVPGPMNGGAVAEKTNGGRVVVIASPTFAFDDLVKRLDPVLWNQGLAAARFPANGELFTNSIFWLGRMEPMIAISPAAMEVSRIGAMSDGALKAWRFGALLVGLPALVMIAGAMVYFARRD